MEKNSFSNIHYITAWSFSLFHDDPCWLYSPNNLFNHNSNFASISFGYKIKNIRPKALTKKINTLNNHHFRDIALIKLFKELSLFIHQHAIVLANYLGVHQKPSAVLPFQWVICPQKSQNNSCFITLFQNIFWKGHL